MSARTARRHRGGIEAKYSTPCNCNQGRLPCPLTCECRRVGMWDDERAHPRLAIALYLGAFALAIVASIAGTMLGSAA